MRCAVFPEPGLPKTSTFSWRSTNFPSSGNRTCCACHWRQPFQVQGRQALLHNNSRIRVRAAPTRFERAASSSRPQPGPASSAPPALWDSPAPGRSPADSYSILIAGWKSVPRNNPSGTRRRSVGRVLRHVLPCLPASRCRAIDKSAVGDHELHRARQARVVGQVVGNDGRRNRYVPLQESAQYSIDATLGLLGPAKSRIRR